MTKTEKAIVAICLFAIVALVALSAPDADDCNTGPGGCCFSSAGKCPKGSSCVCVKACGRGISLCQCECVQPPDPPRPPSDADPRIASVFPPLPLDTVAEITLCRDTDVRAVVASLSRVFGFRIEAETDALLAHGRYRMTLHDLLYEIAWQTDSALDLAPDGTVTLRRAGDRT